MQITLIGHVSAQSTDSNAVTTPSIDITDADLVVVAYSTISAGPVLGDLLGNTWTPLTNQNSSGTNLRFRYSVPTVRGIDTFTVTAGGGKPSIAVAVYKGSLSPSPFDVENGATTGATSSIQPGNVTPSLNNELVIYALTANGFSAADVPTVNVGTILDNLMFTANAVSIALAHEIQTTATARNPTWSWPNLHFNAAVIATFKSDPNKFLVDSSNLVLTRSAPIVVVEAVNNEITPPSKSLVISTSIPNLFNIFPLTKSLVISTSSPVVSIIIGGLVVKSYRSFVKNILVEIDLHDGSVVSTFRIKNGIDGPMSVFVNDERVQYDPRLFTPIELGVRVSAEQYGIPLRGLANVGDIQFAIDESIWSLLDYHWKGREIRVFLANQGDRYEDFELIYKGQVEELTHDTLIGSITTIDLGIKHDTPWVTEFYDNSNLENIRGLPKPRLRGSVKNLEPVLIDEINQIYQISNLSLGEITEIRVGGVVWNETLGLIPGDGEWKGNLTAGTFQLGSTTLGKGVRCDAKSFDWENMTSAFLIKEIVLEVNGEVDEDSMNDLDVNAPYLIGYYSGLSPINCMDLLDQIMAGLVGYWLVGVDGVLKAGLIEAPSDVEDMAFTEVTIRSARQTQLIPPAYRISIEHSRIWNPENQFFEEVTEANKQKYSSNGTIAEVYENLDTKRIEPRAIDVPVIRSLVGNEEDALSIRNRAVDAWGTARKIYEIDFQDEVSPELYSTVRVDYLMIGVLARVHSTRHSHGGGTSVVQIWSEDLPDVYGIIHQDEVLTEDGSNVVLLSDSDLTPLLVEI